MMDRETILALGRYLNETVPMETCDNSLKYTLDWLKANPGEDIDGKLEWIHQQGVFCDCDVVLKLYLPARQAGISEINP